MTAVKPDIALELHNRGYRATPQRLSIYDAIWSAGDHPTAGQIHECAIKRDPTISLATVYKTLQLFTNIGLVREMAFRDDSTRYDPVVDSHINLVCSKCGRVEDFNYEEIEGLAAAIRSRVDFLVSSQSLEVYGICSECRNSS
ncbi:transcriptional repressor [Candidatus Thorarchaeota archaeon]|nr:MAG: transcriptional repressor [Candidatus Thorarchaeota archaeon]